MTNDARELLNYYLILHRNRKFLFVFIASCVLITGLVVILMPNIFVAKAVIEPVEQDQTSMIGAGEMKNLLGMEGAPTRFGELKNLLSGRLLRERVIRKYGLLPVFFEKSELDDMDENEKMWNGLEYLKDNMVVTPQEKDSMIAISMEFKDPKVASDILRHMLFELNEHMSNETKRVAETNRKHLEAQIGSLVDPFLRANLYSLIAKQIQTVAFAEAKEDNFFKVIEPPQVPLWKDKPKRAFLIILSFIVSLFVGVFIVFLREYISQLKADQSEVSEK